MALFDRKISLHVGTLQITNLDVVFTVSKTSTADPNKAEITIYNLSETHRRLLENEKGLEVELTVGYTDDQYEGVIFRGDIKEVYSTLASSDWITKLRTGDGDKAARKTRASNSYAPGTTFNTAWSDLVDALKKAGIGEGNAKNAFSSAKFKDNVRQFVHGGNVVGIAYAELESLARSAGLEVTIHNKSLVVTRNGKALGASAVDLSSKSGLIGSPERGKDGVVKCKALLLPDLYPKRQVKLTSRHISGNYYVYKVDYKGDTRGQNWYAEMELKEL